MRYQEVFPDEASKAKAFDKIAAGCYDGNFGVMSKTEMDTLLFSIYLEALEERRGDGPTGNYELSKALGITQSRVAALKERKYLRYPSPINWKTKVQEALRHGKYENGRIKVFIEDRTVSNEVRHLIQQNHGLAETSMTPGLLTIAVTDVIDLILALDPEMDREKALEQTKNYLRGHELLAQSDLEAIEKQSPRELLRELFDKNKGKIAVETTSQVLELFFGAPGRIIGSVLRRTV